MSEGVWVRLHLVPQTEGNSTMPTFIEGFMKEETPGSYVLMPTIEVNEYGERFLDEKNMNLVNRTYVWRCQVLREKPPTDEDEEYNGEASIGLG